jgi:molecular chaperone GrpE
MNAESNPNPAADAPAESPSQPVLAEAQDAVTRLEAQLADSRDRVLRAQAELDNFRKRTRRELEDERKFALQPLIRDLLPVIDNVGRAIQSAESTPDMASLLAGIKLVAQLLDGVLKSHHCQVINAQGAPFDPNLHQAVTRQPSADQPPHTVLAVLQNGYQLHDRVLRPAQVIVAIAPEENKEGNPS